jgi:hypothetical protein
MHMDRRDRENPTTRAASLPTPERVDFRRSITSEGEALRCVSTGSQLKNVTPRAPGFYHRSEARPVTQIPLDPGPRSPVAAGGLSLEIEAELVAQVEAQYAQDAIHGRTIEID